MTTRIYRTHVRVNTQTPRKRVVFSREILEGAIAEYLAGNMHMGMLEDPGQESTMDLDYDRISHNVTDLWIDADGFMVVELVFLDTDQGKIARMTADLLEVASNMTGFCDWTGESNIVKKDAGIVSLNLRWKTEEIELEAA